MFLLKNSYAKKPSRPAQRKSEDDRTNSINWRITARKFQIDLSQTRRKTNRTFPKEKREESSKRFVWKTNVNMQIEKAKEKRLISRSLSSFSSLFSPSSIRLFELSFWFFFRFFLVLTAAVTGGASSFSSWFSFSSSSSYAETFELDFSAREQSTLSNQLQRFSWWSQAVPLAHSNSSDEPWIQRQ